MSHLATTRQAMGATKRETHSMGAYTSLTHHTLSLLPGYKSTPFSISTASTAGTLSPTSSLSSRDFLPSPSVPPSTIASTIMPDLDAGHGEDGAKTPTSTPISNEETGTQIYKSDTSVPFATISGLGLTFSGALSSNYEGDYRNSSFQASEMEAPIPDSLHPSAPPSPFAQTRDELRFSLSPSPPSSPLLPPKSRRDIRKLLEMSEPSAPILGKKRGRELAEEDSDESDSTKKVKMEVRVPPAKKTGRKRSSNISNVHRGRTKISAEGATVIKETRDALLDQPIIQAEAAVAHHVARCRLCHQILFPSEWHDGLEHRACRDGSSQSQPDSPANMMFNNPGEYDLDDLPFEWVSYELRPCVAAGMSEAEWMEMEDKKKPLWTEERWEACRRLEKKGVKCFREEVEAELEIMRAEKDGKMEGCVKPDLGRAELLPFDAPSPTDSDWADYPSPESYNTPAYIAPPSPVPAHSVPEDAASYYEAASVGSDLPDLDSASETSSVSSSGSGSRISRSSKGSRRSRASKPYERPGKHAVSSAPAKKSSAKGAARARNLSV